MIKRKLWGLLYILIVLGTLAAAEWGCRTVSVMVEAAPLKRGNCIIIDAGHGGEDGGATSCRGVLESTYNLEISLRLNDLFHLLGYDTRMTRTTDTSIYTKGETIAQKKISDLKERVRIVNEDGKRPAAEHPSEQFHRQPLQRRAGVLRRDRGQRSTGETASGEAGLHPEPRQQPKMQEKRRRLSDGTH